MYKLMHRLTIYYKCVNQYSKEIEVGVCTGKNVCLCVCVRRHQDGDAEATRSLEKRAILGGFTRKLRIFCRWKELYAYEAHIEPAIQFPIGGRCHFCRGSDPSTMIMD